MALRAKGCVRTLLGISATSRGLLVQDMLAAACDRRITSRNSRRWRAAGMLFSIPPALRCDGGEYTRSIPGSDTCNAARFILLIPRAMNRSKCFVVAGWFARWWYGFSGRVHIFLYAGIKQRTFTAARFRLMPLNPILSPCCVEHGSRSRLAFCS